MHISQREETVVIFNGKENLSLLHISDIHLWFSVKVLEKLHILITHHNPDVIIMTGDYYDIPRGACLFRRFLSEVAKHHLILFIHGNHDTIYGARISNHLLGITNCICLDNLVYKYQSKSGHNYNFTSWKNKAYLPDDKKEVNIVLLHNPERIKDDELSKIDLILAGHLHGGQFVFFKTKNGSYFPACLLYKNCTDRKQIRETTLIISRGLGDTLPFRFNCPKEIIKVNIL